MSLLHIVLPMGWFGVWTALGRRLNPYVLRAPKIKRALASVLSPGQVDQVWRDWLDSHVRFTQDFLNYDRLDTAWLRNCVVFEQEDVLACLRASGGLVLTYHSHHQNTMCCALGLRGCTVSALAAAPQDSPLFSFIGHWATQVNAKSEQHFRGGRYLFLNDLRSLSRGLRDALAQKQVLVCLSDFHQPSARAVSGQVLGRCMAPPTGAIEVALKLGAPIYVAMFAPIRGKLHLRLTKLKGNGAVPEIIGQYLTFLESCVLANPSCWQGWDWLGDLPLSES